MHKAKKAALETEMVGTEEHTLDEFEDEDSVVGRQSADVQGG